ncbi:SIR2 family protein [Paraburkholderia bannensis]|uniref:SIR2 family protein n=1 Tax=Paraburkholderia bannensis TaxID=765414 RepID=UPI002ABDDBAD|nr:SIR2 family protein [Paraburkholderia bannensis]
MNMLDPIISLSFSMQSNKGVYAVLLGSGVSRSSRIPTGWEIVIELVRKVAALQGENCEPHPVAWYANKFGRQPDYGELLDAVARTPDERQALLRPYFEPTATEREEGAKMPTRAHRAIAKLVRDGYVRLIVTTNFDRLMERALEDEGIAPIVVSGPDQLAGLQPLAHLGCCIVKVHGDYLDTRIRNTPSELDSYAPAMNDFLDRVFDEFGLVVCGWSADWDVALRACIERAPSRRYSMYLAYRGALGESATNLIALRAGHPFTIAGADQFFEELQSKVKAIEEFSKPHPLSKEIAVASVKRYLSDPSHRIRLSDLIESLARDLTAKLHAGPFADTNANPTVESVTHRVRTYDSMTSTLVSVAATVGRWGDAAAVASVRRAVERVYAIKQTAGLVIWLGYQNYPATLIAYATLLGASLSGNLVSASAIFAGKTRLDNAEVPFARTFPPTCILQSPQDWGRLLQGMERRHVPLNDWIQATLWDALGSEFVSRAEFELHFDWVEIVLALAYGHSNGVDETYIWMPPGSFGYRSASREEVLGRITTSLTEEGTKSSYVRSGLFGATPAACEALVGTFRQFVKTLRWY